MVECVVPEEYPSALPSTSYSLEKQKFVPAFDTSFYLDGSTSLQRQISGFYVQKYYNREDKNESLSVVYSLVKRSFSDEQQFIHKIKSNWVIGPNVGVDEVNCDSIYDPELNIYSNYLSYFTPRLMFLCRLIMLKHLVY